MSTPRRPLLLLFVLLAGCASEGSIRRQGTRNVGGLDYEKETIYRALVRSISAQGLDLEVSDPIAGEVVSALKVRDGHILDKRDHAVRVEGRLSFSGGAYTVAVFAGHYKRKRAVDQASDAGWWLEGPDAATTEAVLASFRSELGLP